MAGGAAAPGRRPRLAAGALAAAVVAAVAALAAAACGGGGTPHPVSPSPSPSAPVAHIAITPADGARRADPAKGIRVKVTDGTITSVRVTAPGETVNGRLSSDSTTWRSRWTLATGARYTVTVKALGPDGRTTTAVSSFRTLVPAETFSAQIFEGYDLTYGVGMPIILTFDRPVVYRNAVERSLRLRTSKPVVGAWYWDGSSTLYFRPRDYWPPHTTVHFVGHLDGVEAAPGVYGTHTLTQRFQIGRSLIVVASTRTHHIRVYLDRRLYGVWPISTGRPGDNTPNGTYLTIEKHNPQHMKGPGYDLEVPWSVRFTWSGDFLHDAYWSVGEQGFTNVSHGCINLSPAHAQTYYQLAIPGDPVTVGGSPKGGKWDDGWTMWFLSWRQLLAGSALHKAVSAGPRGSTFVEPASLAPSGARAPLGRPSAGNSQPS